MKKIRDLGGRGWDSTIGLPGGITPGEGRLLLRLLARLKAWRFGRLAVKVREGRVVDIEVVQKVDRALFRPLWTDGGADKRDDRTPPEQGG